MRYDRPLLTVLTVTWLLFLAAVAAAAGDDQFFYKWKDDQGVVHLTDSLEKVPSEYRSRAQRFEKSERDDTGEAPAVQQPPVSGIPSGSDEGAKAAWQQRMREAKRRLANAEDRYRQLEQKKEGFKAKWGSAGAALPPQDAIDQIKAIEGDMQRVKQEIERARDMVENVIPDEARKAGIPPGWLREVE